MPLARALVVNLQLWLGRIVVRTWILLLQRILVNEGQRVS